MHPSACVTVDLDTTRFYRDIHGLPARHTTGPDATYTLGVQRLLALFAQCGIRSTLFVIGEDVEPHLAMLKRAHKQGHELGNHTYHHRYDLRAQTHATICQDIERGEEALARITGKPPRGFRTPGYNIDAQIFEELERRGYLYDSSVFPCPPYYFAKGAIMAGMALRGKPSRSMMTPAAMMLAPTRAYRPSSSNIWRAHQRSTRMWEVPMCLVPGVRFPLIGTSLHLVGTKGFGALLPLLRRRYRRLLQLEFHAMDFMDSSDEGMQELVGIQPDLKIPWAEKRARYMEIFGMISQHYAFMTLAEAVRRLP